MILVWMVRTLVRIYTYIYSWMTSGRFRRIRMQLLSSSVYTYGSFLFVQNFLSFNLTSLYDIMIASLSSRKSSESCFDYDDRRLFCVSGGCMSFYQLAGFLSTRRHSASSIMLTVVLCSRKRQAGFLHS